MCDIDASAIQDILDDLEGMVFEDELKDQVEGIYMWRSRHARIAEIIADSKFSQSEREQIILDSIECLNNSVACERQFGAMLCNSNRGIDTMDAGKQTATYRRLIEVLPFERVPRHRLIRNLLRDGELGPAELAIYDTRQMKLDDSVVSRYEVEMLIKKASTLRFLEAADKLNILESAVGKAEAAISRRGNDMYNYRTYATAALEYSIQSRSTGRLVDAISKLKAGYEYLGDVAMLEWIGQFEREKARVDRMISQNLQPPR